jgi:diacylglycerol kinase (ATP)
MSVPEPSAGRTPDSAPLPPSDLHPAKARRGLDRIVHAAGYSLAGLRQAYRGEAAFREELWLALAMAPFAFVLGRDWVQTALLLACLVAVLVVELLNSAVEAAIDRISYEVHPLSKRAKDLGSAAVLLSLLLCGGVWATAIWQRLG